VKIGAEKSNNDVADMEGSESNDTDLSTVAENMVIGEQASAKRRHNRRATLGP